MKKNTRIAGLRSVFGTRMRRVTYLFLALSPVFMVAAAWWPGEKPARIAPKRSGEMTSPVLQKAKNQKIPGLYRLLLVHPAVTG